MKKLLLFILFLAVSFFGLNYIKISPCDTPIKYKIGSLDERFNLTQQQFKSDIDKAVNLWSNALNKSLFVFDPNGSLTVNAVYDERQALNNQITSLENQLSTGEKTLDSQVLKYQEELRSLNKALTDLNTDIQTWNAKGGAPPDVYKEILSKQQSLRAEVDSINQLAKSLNQKTQTYNSQVINVNSKINTFNADLLVKPEEGLYIPDTDTINIYFNISQNELVHTLAHELGHARGLEHSTSEKDIMYPQSSEIIVLSKNDTAAINKACVKKSFIELAQERIYTTMSNVKNN